MNERGAPQVARFAQLQAAYQRRRRNRRSSDLGKVVSRQAFERSIADADAGVKGLEIEVDIAAGAFNRKIDVRMPGHEAGQPRNQPGGSEHRKYLEPQPLASRLARCRRSGACEFGKGPAGGRGEDLAIRGRMDGAMRAYEQRNAERLLEVANSMTDGGRTEIEKLRRGLETAGANRDVEGLQRKKL